MLSSSTASPSQTPSNSNASSTTALPLLDQLKAAYPEIPEKELESWLPQAKIWKKLVDSNFTSQFLRIMRSTALSEKQIMPKLKEIDKYVGVTFEYRKLIRALNQNLHIYPREQWAYLMRVKFLTELNPYKYQEQINQDLKIAQFLNAAIAAEEQHPYIINVALRKARLYQFKPKEALFHHQEYWQLLTAPERYMEGPEWVMLIATMMAKMQNSKPALALEYFMLRLTAMKSEFDAAILKKLDELFPEPAMTDSQAMMCYKQFLSQDQQMKLVDFNALRDANMKYRGHALTKDPNLLHMKLEEIKALRVTDKLRKRIIATVSSPSYEASLPKINWESEAWLEKEAKLDIDFIRELSARIEPFVKRTDEDSKKLVLKFNGLIGAYNSLLGKVSMLSNSNTESVKIIQMAQELFRSAEKISLLIEQGVTGEPNLKRDSNLNIVFQFDPPEEEPKKPTKETGSRKNKYKGSNTYSQPGQEIEAVSGENNVSNEGQEPEPEPGASTDTINATGSSKAPDILLQDWALAQALAAGDDSKLDTGEFKYQSSKPGKSERQEGQQVSQSSKANSTVVTPVIAPTQSVKPISTAQIVNVLKSAPVELNHSVSISTPINMNPPSSPPAAAKKDEFKLNSNAQEFVPMSRTQINAAKSVVAVPSHRVRPQDFALRLLMENERLQLQCLEYKSVNDAMAHMLAMNSTPALPYPQVMPFQPMPMPMNMVPPSMMPPMLPPLASMIPFPQHHNPSIFVNHLSMQPLPQNFTQGGFIPGHLPPNNTFG